MDRHQEGKVYGIVLDTRDVVKTAISGTIKVTVHIPEKISDASKQQKINRIYDILNPNVPH